MRNIFLNMKQVNIIIRFQFIEWDMICSKNGLKENTEKLALYRGFTTVCLKKISYCVK